MKKINLLILISLFISTTFSQSYTLSTFAGGGFGDEADANLAKLNNPVSVVKDAAGNIYFSDENHFVVRKINKAGIITTYAGNGTEGYSGDGGLATKAQLNHPRGLALDAEGNLFICDKNNHCIRKVSVNGYISTVIGKGYGDGLQATNAVLNKPVKAIKDANGNIFIIDQFNNRIRKVTPNGVISTFAGNGQKGYSGDGGPATNASFNIISGIALDAVGNLYVADFWNNCVRKISTAGIISTIAGNGESGFAGDGGPANKSLLSCPEDVTLDKLGNVYISTGDRRIRKIGLDGIISTFAGVGNMGYSGDGGLAINAEFNSPVSIVLDDIGNMYVADCYNNVVRKINTAGVVSTIAGTGGGGFTGDGGLATAAELYSPIAVALDASNNLYITTGGRIRKVDQNGIITTFVGKKTDTFSGDGGNAALAGINFPQKLFVDSEGNLLFADAMNQRIRMVNSKGIINTIVGNGFTDYCGDGELASRAMLNSPEAIAIDTKGTMYITDASNFRIRKVEVNGIISTFAGNGLEKYSGDGGLATSASLNGLSGIAVDKFGNVFLSAGLSHIRKVDVNGIISNFAGNGESGFKGDGGLAISASLNSPEGLACDASGNVYLADASNNRIRKISTNGIISTIVGNGINSSNCPSDFGNGGQALNACLFAPSGVFVDALGEVYIADGANQRIRKVDNNGIISNVAGVTIFSGDGGLAISAELFWPTGITLDSKGNKYIADQYHHIIRKVDKNGVITTIAGRRFGAFSGDGGLATEAVLNSPQGVAVDKNGNIFIADTYNNRIRKIDLNGIITTVAGSQGYGAFGDGGLATSATLYQPADIAIDKIGNLYIADRILSRIRKVDTNGIITTVAGNVYAGFSGDGGPANLASLNEPYDIAVDEAGNLFIADKYNHRIRKVDTNGIITTVAGTGNAGTFKDGNLAINAELNAPAGLTIDKKGEIYFTQFGIPLICKIDINGIITTIAGNKVQGNWNNGGDALKCALYYPMGIALDSTGQIYFADELNNRIGVLTPTTEVLNLANQDNYNEYFYTYPNPSSGKFRLSVNTNILPKQFTIIDIYGEIICEQSFNSSSTVDLDLSAYSKGIYFVNIVSSDNRIFCKKMVIE
jgi:sugar lactone lactonase YvrE